MRVAPLHAARAQVEERECCRRRYCATHAEHTEDQAMRTAGQGHSHDHGSKIKFSSTGWMPGDVAPPLGRYEGMPVKKAIALRKADARAAAKQTKRARPAKACPHCGGVIN